MGRSLDISIPHTSRARQLFTPRRRYSSLGIRTVAILLFWLLFRGQQLFFLYRDALGAKYSPTTFATSDLTLSRSSFTDPNLPKNLLSNRDQWRVLGAGWEGTTFEFNGSVIKTFTPGRSPFRNCVLGGQSSRWPTEIPASLLFGGSWIADDSLQPNTSAITNNTISGLLPVQTHFMATSSLYSVLEWHLVTPLVSGGNLNNLAHRLKLLGKNFRDLDIVYRPAFNRLLNTLGSLHSRGFCHDDIKPSNIFVKDDAHWILGDLGNVRHISHPYHSSRLWTIDNDQLPDCRANDVLRALKSYLQFLRAATPDRADFDMAFFDGREAINRLFWWTVEDPSSLSAVELHERSELEHSRRHSDWGLHPHICPHHFPSLFLGRRRAMARVVDEALRTRFREMAARWAALTWVFGIPLQEC